MTLTHVNGIEVVERQKAIGATGTVGAGAQIQSIDELLLTDGTTIFHCTHKNAVDCEYVNQAMRSVMAHQRTHGDRMQAKRANEKAEELAAQLADIAAKEQQKKANYSAGAKKAHEARKAKQLQTPAEVSAKPARGPVLHIGDTDLAKKAQQVIIAYNALQDAHDQFQNVFLGYMRSAQVASDRPTPVIDPQIIAKAKQYDIIQAALKGTN